MRKPTAALAIALFGAAGAAGDAAGEDRNGEPRALAFQPGSTTLILVLDETRRPRLFDFADPARPKLVLTLPEASAAAFVSRDRIATGHADGTIRPWTLDGQPAGRPVRASAKAVEALILSPSGRLVATLDNDHAVTLWTSALARRVGPLRKAEKCLFAAEPRVSEIAFRPDESLIAAATKCGNLAVWTTQGTAVAVPPPPKPSGLIFAFGFTGDGASLAAHSQGHPGYFGHIYPVAQGRFGPARAVPEALFGTFVWDIVPARGAAAFLYATGDGIALVTAAGARGAAIQFGRPAKIAVSDDGKRLAAFNHALLALWDEARNPLGEVRLSPQQ